MNSQNLDPIYRRLRGDDPDEVMEAVFDLKKTLPDLDRGLDEEVASALASLFYIDTNDRPDLRGVVDQAIHVVAAMGPELIPHHLDEMKGTDFKALLCYGRVLSEIGSEAVDPVLQALKESEDPNLIVGAIYGLSKITHDSAVRAIPAILEICDHPDGEVRDTAVRAVGKLALLVEKEQFSSEERTAMYDSLVRATTDKEPGVRAKGVRGLGVMARTGLLNEEQKSAAEARVRQIVGQHDHYHWDRAFIVRREAEEALEHLGGSEK
jgi:hypothetical protein